MSSDASYTVQQIIDAGHDLLSLKYYSFATSALLFYDYLLTLGDEIEFGWRGRKTWVFALFLANRYLPIAYSIWSLVLHYGPIFSQRICDKTAFLSVLAFVVVTVIAEIVLTLRIYAVTRKNRVIAACFGVITASQFALGVRAIIVTATPGAQKVIPIPLNPYNVCVFIRHRRAEIGFTAISIAYDLLAFLLIAYLALRSNVYELQMPSLLKTIVQDATHYFLVIFTSHIVLELTLVFGRPEIQLLPAVGSVVYIPVMITRLMLSLKKATITHESGWSMGEPSSTTMRFADNRPLGTVSEGTHLDTLASGLPGL